MTLANYLLRGRKTLKTDMRRARMDINPEAFVARAIKLSAFGGIAAAALVFFFFSKKPDFPMWTIPLIALVGVYIAYQYFMITPKIKSLAIAADIDREVLFAGRFLLIKLNSGTPLVTALEEASKSYGVGGRYFAEIMRDIELGTPLEDAIERAMNNSPSRHWRKILFQIHNALRLGIDVTHSLEAVLEDITNDYLLQIQRYGKKLSTITLFYLLIAVVVPSLGMTILVVLVSFTGIPLTAPIFLGILAGVIFIQVLFLNVFRSIRPKVTL
jgi:flagellar protein FlaJ